MGSEDCVANTPFIKTIERDVYFYSDINSESVLTLWEHLRQADRLTSNLNSGKLPIRLYIHSIGGDGTAVWGFVDQLKSSLVNPIHSIVTGIAASAATFISMACDKRYIFPNSHMLIHQLSAIFWSGTYSQLEDNRVFLKQSMKQISDFYVKYSNLTKKDVDEKLRHETWITPKQALKWGMVDEILK